MGDQVAFEIDGDSSKGNAALQKLIDQNKSLDKSFGEVAKSAERASQVAMKALDAQTGATKKLSKENEELKKKIEAVGARSDSLGKSMLKDFSKIQNVIGVGIVASLTKAAQMQDEWLRKVAETARKQDELGRKVQIQAAMSDPAFQKQLKSSIAPTARKYGVTLQEAQDLAQELLNQGVEAGSAMGKGGGGVLGEVMAGSMAMGSDNMKEVGAGGIGFLRGRGEDATPENVRGIMQDMTGLFEKNRLLATDIGELSKIGSLTKQLGLSQRETLSMFTLFRHEGSFDASQSAVSMRNILTKMAAPNPDALELIEKVGGKGYAKKFDMEGESLPQAAQAYADMLNATPKDQRVRMLTKSFETENLAAAQLMFPTDKDGKVSVNSAFFRHIDEQKRGKEIFADQVGIATGGVARQQKRLQLDEQMHEIGAGNPAARSEAFLDAFEQVERESGMSELRIWYRNHLRRGERFVGFDPMNEAAISGNTSGFSTTLNLSGNQKLAQEALRRVNQSEKATDPSAVKAPAVADIRPGVSKFVKPLPEGTELLDHETELDNQIAAARALAGSSRLKVTNAKFAAEDEGSEGGRKITHAEQRIIDALDHAADKLDLIVKGLEQKKAEEEVAKKKNIPPPQINRGANRE